MMLNLPKTTKRLSLFGGFNRLVSPVKEPGYRISYAWISPREFFNLERLSLSFLFEATHFLLDSLFSNGAWRCGERSSRVVEGEYELWQKNPRELHSRLLQEANIRDKYYSSWCWPEMKQLTLTPMFLASEMSETCINNLLHMAAKTVRRMPKLQVMEI
ncbi:hypothetical protein B0H67DRAFT_579388 [Lasiosphaeris hirsuta]|uniref:DUF6546 domain-containing protein n=1 Tax=Lasiosphaeris hirsuta TaxID=260670 RepID=A0AA40AFH4_9PEZI|nr:hypothetical protein B0H67DRAFT_579388 [Lasiosphaeris hirsuta]